jgi:hypothetical protein
MELSSSTLVSNGYFIRTEDDLGARSMYKDIDMMYPQSEGAFNLAVLGTNAKVSGGALTTGFDSTDRTFDPSSGYKVDTRQSGRYINIRVTMSGTVNPKLTSIQFSLKPTSRR